MKSISGPLDAGGGDTESGCGTELKVLEGDVPVKGDDDDVLVT